MAAVAVADVAAKGGDFDDGGVWAISCRDVARKRLPQAHLSQLWHQHHSELRAHCIGLRKDPHDFIRRGIGSDVVVGGLATQQQIAHASADEIGLVAVRRAACG